MQHLQESVAKSTLFFGRDRAGVVGLSTNALPIRMVYGRIRMKLCRLDSGLPRMRGRVGLVEGEDG